MTDKIATWLLDNNLILCSIAAIIAIGGAVYGTLHLAWRIWQRRKQKQEEEKRAIFSAIWPNNDRS